ncbi:lamin tail domain-containing protein [Nonomuraea sp. SYSU D8015]|uniref:lamin tail domain-containing protein n=1 Tax=Nonomuraea sp. SYSU D8015 TaxID=2593644 RepID=UPI001CB70649|nr:lamin tail domain-containing protein [Nonomuraea sp. SYSU D8015]
MFRRLAPAAAAGTALLASTLAAAPAQAAAPAVQIVKVYYDSPGADRRSNSSLNAEYVVLKNTTRKTIQLERWVLRDETGYKYRFGPFTLKPGKTVTVRSGSGEDGTSTVYWNRRQYVWNNDGDTASIHRGSDLKKIDTCSWGSAGDWTNCQ